MSRWRVERSSGPASVFHARELPQPAVPMAWVFEVDRPAIVVGSRQPLEDLDRNEVEGASIEIVRRRSGGGAVLLEPGGTVWIDVIVPRGDRLWSDDVVASASWLGEAWAEVLDELGVGEVQVHHGPLVADPLAPVLCFAALGPGEVSAGNGKTVGLSQRRTRDAARFQCTVPLVWNHDLHARLLGPGLRRIHPDAADPRAIIDAVPVRPLVETGGDPDPIVSVFLDRLSRR